MKTVYTTTITQERTSIHRVNAIEGDAIDSWTQFANPGVLQDGTHNIPLFP